VDVFHVLSVNLVSPLSLLTTFLSHFFLLFLPSHQLSLPLGRCGQGTPSNVTLPVSGHKVFRRISPKYSLRFLSRLVLIMFICSSLRHGVFLWWGILPQAMRRSEASFYFPKSSQFSKALFLRTLDGLLRRFETDSSPFMSHTL